MKICVIEINNNLYIIKTKGFHPDNCIGHLSSNINEKDYPYIIKTPIYDEIDTELIIGYNFEVDEDAKNNDPNYNKYPGDL